MVFFFYPFSPSTAQVICFWNQHPSTPACIFVIKKHTQLAELPNYSQREALGRTIIHAAHTPADHGQRGEERMDGGQLHTPSHILDTHTHNLHADTVYFVPNYIPSFQHTKESLQECPCAAILIMHICFSLKNILCFFALNQTNQCRLVCPHLVCLCIEPWNTNSKCQPSHQHDPPCVLCPCSPARCGL